MDKLIAKLKEFDEARTGRVEFPENHFPAQSSSDKIIADCFEPIAKYVLNDGYLQVECVIGKESVRYGIRIDTLELYYHEELPDGYVDPIMYHSNWRLPKSMKDRGMKSYPYFELGSFNLHTSGVDVTFENEAKQYRASFLIRAFSIIKSDNTDLVPNMEFDKCSTHIFDYLFPNGVSVDAMKGISWQEYGSDCQKPECVLCGFPRKRQGAKVFELKPGVEIKYTRTESPCLKEWQFGREL